MRSLIIDNDTRLLTELTNLAPGEKVIRHWDDIQTLDLSQFELIILSGNSKQSYAGHETEYAREIELIKSTPCPLIGICFGAELITIAFGGTLKKSPATHKGLKEITVLSPDPIFNNQKTFTTYECHQWVIDTAPENFTVLAKSDHGIEAIKHKSQPIYGFQFHPEHLRSISQSDEIFETLVRSFQRS